MKSPLGPQNHASSARDAVAATRAAPRAAVRVAAFAFYLVVGVWLFLVLSHFRPLLHGTAELAARVATAVVLLAAALAARASPRWRDHWPALFAFFAAGVATSIDRYLTLGQQAARLAGIALQTPAGVAADKVGGGLTIIVLVIVAVLVSGEGLPSLRIRKGRLLLGLAIGLATFVVAAAGSIPVATAFFGGRDLTLGRIVPWIPWVLLFIAFNASNEELLFRGLLLGRLEPLFGRLAANLLIAAPFVLLHSGVPYTADSLAFFAMLLPLSLAWGWLAQKTDSLWGSVLFHAGMDIPVILGILAQLPEAR